MPKAQIAILGREFEVKKPPQFVVKEELVVAYGDALDRKGHRLRVAAAVLGICSPELQREARADYRAASFDPLAYGGAVYSFLRQRGATAREVIEQAEALVVELTDEIFPRQSEVIAAVGNSVPGMDA